MHLFLYGESGAGKSFAVERALSLTGITPERGFRTQKQYTGGEAAQLVMRHNGKVTPLAVWESGPWPRVIPGAFDAAGAEALSGVEPGDVVIMDELGRFEQDAAAFQQAVLSTLRLPCRTIGVFKDEELPFIHAVRDTPCVRAVPISETTRAEVHRIVRDFLRPRTLREALGVGIGVTAAVGGGGKTTLLTRLGRELAAEDKVILTTTTHLSIPTDIPWAEDTDTLWRLLEKNNLVCIGKRLDEYRLGAPDVSMETLFSMCDHLLVEADGSRNLPVKAHAAHEPAIPAGARTIGVIGASAFGKTVAECVHRPELFCQAPALGEGVTEDTRITGALLARAAVHADTVLLNQVETAAQLAEARAFARAHKGKTVLSSLWRARPVIEIWEGDLCVW